MKTLVSICLISALTSTAFADFRSGVEAYQRGNDVIALQEFWMLAQQGHAGSQFNLGVLYARGRGVTQDFSQAARWYRLAAEHGHALAQCNLGALYEEGTGVVRNDEEASRWYRLAAEQGNAGGQNNLGRLYEEGRGVLRSSNEARTWYQKAADQGNKQAQANLMRLSVGASIGQSDSNRTASRQ